ncbi:alpha/beta hydrolase [Fuerstiella marisgermanici]|uniref:Alpha/beta hydrolase family protein n=1 Tax=Fuerstiella marisgermanici TaxID=1891926 RepID=A0A1P8WNW8_9PLAN|nr:alpha/beta fold hydrolase [Fuerstiella marisgermanici]APZ95750.1 hypothetical protein Fuma_05412 [Fuerstiella marisgermanici]
MNGIFRYAKGVAASLIIAAVGFAGNYAQSWLFRGVEGPLPRSTAVLSGNFALSGHSSSPQRSTIPARAAEWRIAFVTNRLDAVADSATTASTATSLNGRTLSEQTVDAICAMPPSTHGFSEVTVPFRRRRGECVVGASAESQLQVRPLKRRGKADFYSSLQTAIDEAESKDILVFVHGFNVSLDNAIARAAQLAEDMPFHGVVIAFSWQSHAKTTEYLSDERLAERYFWNLAELLAELRNQFDDSVRLNVLAHSMGNRVALRAISALTGNIDPTGQPTDRLQLASLNRRFAAGQGFPLGRSDADGRFNSVVGPRMQDFQTRFPAWRSWSADRTETSPISNLILAAPDVAQSEFKTFINHIRHAASNIVLITSDTDYALKASRKIHNGRYRAGDSQAALNIEGVNTIRVTGVHSLDHLGHSHYGSNVQVLDRLAAYLRPTFDVSQSMSAFAR